MRICIQICTEEIGVVQFLQRVLEKAGYDVVGNVGDKRAAVEYAQTYKPHFILMDTIFADKYGLHTIEAITASGWCPIILMTDRPCDAMTASAKPDKEYARLEKSFDAEPLLQMVSRASELLRAGRLSVPQQSGANSGRRQKERAVFAPSPPHGLRP